MAELVQTEVPGLLAYADGAPAGWVSIGQRDRFARVSRSDDPGSWLIACFYVDQAFRGLGLTRFLLEAAVGYALEHGARQIDAVPRGWRAAGIPGPSAVGRLLLDSGFEPTDPVSEGVNFRKVL
jgi:GNAT superfamily N-acetyltransferase